MDEGRRTEGGREGRKEGMKEGGGAGKVGRTRSVESKQHV